MRAGLLYRRVTLQRFTEIDDGWGTVQEWADLFSTRAQVLQQSGREFFEAGGLAAVRRVVFRLRFRAGVTVLDRVMYRGLAHNIEDVRELGRGAGLELHTVANASGAVS